MQTQMRLLHLTGSPGSDREWEDEGLKRVSIPDCGLCSGILATACGLEVARARWLAEPWPPGTAADAFLRGLASCSHMGDASKACILRAWLLAATRR